MSKNIGNIIYAPERPAPDSEAQIKEVYLDIDEGREAVLDAYKRDEELFITWLEETSPQKIEERWREPSPQNEDRTFLEALAHGWNGSRESWVRYSLGQAATALNGGQKRVPLVNAQAGPSWFENEEMARGYFGVLGGLPLKVTDGTVPLELIKERSKFNLHKKTIRGLPAPQSFGGLVVETTTVTQITFRRLAQGVYVPGSVGNKPNALLLQSWRIK